jgi:alkylhydroperoxidase family enzyme
VTDPYADERRALVEAVTGTAGHLAPAVRRAIMNRARGRADAAAIPGALLPFVDRVAQDATLIEDGDIDALLSAGLDEEAVFEAVVAAALGASLVRLEAVDVLLEGGG